MVFTNELTIDDDHHPSHAHAAADETAALLRRGNTNSTPSTSRASRFGWVGFLLASLALSSSAFVFLLNRGTTFPTDVSNVEVQVAKEQHLLRSNQGTLSETDVGFTTVSTYLVATEYYPSAVAGGSSSSSSSGSNMRASIMLGSENTKNGSSGKASVLTTTQIDPTVHIGENSCNGSIRVKACDGGVHNADIKDLSCNGERACKSSQNIVIEQRSCNGMGACENMEATTIGPGSCNSRGVACINMKHSTIGMNSCNYDYTCGSATNIVIGNGSCNALDSCLFSKNGVIGNNSCNADYVCMSCNGHVPDNACNDLNGKDIDENQKCIYCVAQIDPTVHIGENSCNDKFACDGGVHNADIKDLSCNGEQACQSSQNIVIEQRSCNGLGACEKMEATTIGPGSCNSGVACINMKHSTIGMNSCNYDYTCGSATNIVIGNGSCNALDSCLFSTNGVIGNNSCNADYVCMSCNGHVPDNACNDLNGKDIDENHKCIYCV